MLSSLTWIRCFASLRPLAGHPRSDPIRSTFMLLEEQQRRGKPLHATRPCCMARQDKGPCVHPRVCSRDVGLILKHMIAICPAVLPAFQDLLFMSSQAIFQPPKAIRCHHCMRTRLKCVGVAGVAVCTLARPTWVRRRSPSVSVDDDCMSSNGASQCST